MLTVHLLGHAHVTLNDRPVPLSAKAVALITYLAMEKLPQHRERLADLLWNTAEARKNLRVELARIRSAGLDIFPLSRQLLYLEHVTTDLELWRSRLNSEMDQAELAIWLATLRGLPLSGLEDLGSSAFQEWVDQQRWTLNEQTEQLLCRAYRRFERDGKTRATRAIAARAEALGFGHPESAEPDGELELEPPAEIRSPAPLPAAVQLAAQPVAQLVVQSAAPLVPGAPLHFEDSGKEQALGAALERAEAGPQLVVLHGPVGSGKSYLAERVLNSGEWLTVRVSNSRMSRLALATIAQALLPFTSQSAAETLREVLLKPGTLEEDVVKVAMSLATIHRSVAIVLDHAHNAPVELASLFEFLLQAPGSSARALILLSRTPPAQAPLCRSLLRRFDAQHALQLELTPLSLGSVERALGAGEQGSAPQHALAAQMLQRSEGNVLHLLNLLKQPQQERQERCLPTAMRETYAGEVDGWPALLRETLSSLSVINGDFDLQLAETALGQDGAGELLPVLREALARRSLVEVDPDLPLNLLTLTPQPQAARTEPRYRFQTEGLRVTLAGRLPHEDRQAVRRRLVTALERSDPGLAHFYAERAGAGLDTERLKRIYQAGLPSGSPLTQPAPRPSSLRPPLAAEPLRVRAGSSASKGWRGYLLTWEQGGWLNLMSQGYYGHPKTLRLQLPLPAQGPAPVEVRLVWRLDVFRGGEELGPVEVPFPLRVGVVGADSAEVLTPLALHTYQEQGQQQTVHADVALGTWMEHRLSVVPQGPDSVLELSLRALDVALTIGELSIGGQSLLDLTAHPEKSAAGHARVGHRSISV